MPLLVRKATGRDAERIIDILQRISGERIYTAISTPWSAERQREYIESLSSREVVHVAESDSDGIVGYQPLELWASTLDSMAHVGQVGTFIRPEWRRRGVGEQLFATTLDFARQQGYGKFVILVRSSNISAQRFYGRLGFRECGRLTRQVRIDGREDDEILMEFFL